ncbi:beta strand repeat-containing protein, partial [Gluconacetobacter tumulicola]
MLTLARRHQTSLRLALIGFSILTPVSAFAQALPTGGAYVAGSGTIASAGATTTITQSSARGVINWQGFSIGAGGTVQFNNGSGATLNRVTGSQMSTIQGHLGATGSVFLINPNGVVIGPKGTVVAGGSFVASTRDTPDSAFMKGNAVTLSGTSSGTVKNEGHITSTGGNVVLVGRSVTNGGTIEATGGTVALAAGDKVVLSEADGPDGIYVVADAKAKGDVTNTGRIRAAAATLASAGGNVYALAGNRQGLVQATGTKTVDGQVWLTAPNGSVTVDGTTATATNEDGSGGTIRANGGTVTVGGQATLSASAARPGAKGGRVLVGTDAPGGVNLARRTTIADGATVAATGKGGGKGGMIETSAHTLALGKASVNAGVGGSWLLDPDDLTIDASAASTINAALGSGTDVTEQTSATTASNINGGGTSTSGNGDIFVNAPLNWNSTASLTLSAWRNVAINAAITVAGNGTLNILTNTQGATVNPGGLTFSGGNVAFTGTTGGALNINSQPYTLLRNASDLTSVQSGGYYALAGNLDATSLGTLASAPVSSWSGTFEGLGNTISNLTIHDSTGSYVGLFGTISSSGVVENIGVVGVNVTGGNGSGYLGGLAGVNYGTIRGAYTAGTVSGSGSDLGGLVGMNARQSGSTAGTITNSSSAANVTGSGTYGTDIGGLVGINEATISSSVASGSVSAGSGNTTSYVGGLVGYNVGTITNAYASGAVTSGTIVGGLVGSNTTLTILQTTMRGQITNAYATGTVTGSTNVGQFAGQNASTITNAYFDTNISSTTPAVGTGSSSGITGLTTVQLAGALPGTFGSSVWGNLNNQTTPYLLGVGTNQQVYFGSDATFSAATPVWLIFTPAGLQAVNADPAANYALANSLDLSGISNFTPLAGSGFTGTFDGRGNTIANLTINDGTDAQVGLFAQLGNSSTPGVIQNIGLSGGNVTANANGSSVGELVGYIVSGTLTNAYMTGTVTANGGNNSVGGLVGTAHGPITNAYAAGSVTATGGSSQVGGLVGVNAYAGTMTNVYATGSVFAAGNSNYVGGLAGVGATAITNAYAAGSVTGTGTYVGGLLGAKQGSLTNGYFDQTAAGTSTGAGFNYGSGTPIGLTTAQWASEGPTVPGSPYSFSTPGDWVSGSPYPILKALPYIVIQASGTQIYGQGTATVVFNSVRDQNGLDVSGKIDTTALSWSGTNLSAATSVGNSAPLVIHGSVPGYQTIYTGTDTVIKAALTVTALNQSSIYGQTPSLGTSQFSASGLVNGDTVSGVTLTTTATGASTVGRYGITASAAQGSGLAN